MPNHVTNVLAIRGDSKHVAEFLERIKNDKNGVGSVDFNKIIPMPAELSITAGSKTDGGLRKYREYISGCMFEDRVTDADQLVLSDKREQMYLKAHADIDEEEWALGKTAYDNIRKYGSPTWYEWSVKHWGTKWNAYDCSYDEADCKLTFLTAWSAPHPVVAALAAMYPALYIMHEWADEDIGQNCGRYEYYGGERTDEYFPLSEKSCIEFAADVMKCSPADYGLYLNAAGVGYIQTGLDEYELIELFGKPALFTNERLSPVDIPNGMYCYHLREADDGSHFATIEPQVMVNHGGTVITDEPIDFGEHGFIGFTDETSPNFLGQHITFGEYMRGEFEMDEDCTEEKMEGLNL